MNTIQRTNIVAILLFLFGLSQIVGYLIDSKILRGIGAASTLAPFPKVFSDVDGIETFASNFKIEYTDMTGVTKSLEITPSVYAQLKGPYNRRNVYGAALSYGPTPKFPDHLFNRVFEYALIEPGTLRQEFGLPDNIVNVRLFVATKTEGRNGTWVLPKNKN